MVVVLMKFLLNKMIIVAVRNGKVGRIDFTPTAVSLQPEHKLPAIQITILEQTCPENNGK